MSGLTIVAGQQLVVDDKPLDDLMKENGIEESIFVADYFDVSLFRVTLAKDVNNFRDGCNTNMPKMFRRKYVNAIN